LADNRTGLAATFGAVPTTMADFANQYTYDRLNRLTRVTQAGVSGGNAVADNGWTSATPPTASRRPAPATKT